MSTQELRPGEEPFIVYTLSDASGLTAEMVTKAGDVPPAVATALHGVLEGNVKKVLISIGLWLPYLLLSKRVNVTYRQRLPA